MKNNIIILLLLSFFFNGLSQNSKYDYHGRFTPSIEKEKLNEARFITEIMPEFCRYFSLPYKEQALLNQRLKLVDYVYPKGNYIYFHAQENYEEIMNFVSIEVSAICQGKNFTYQSTGKVLTTEQKSILNAADLGTDISIKIKFNYKNWASSKFDSENYIKEGKYIVTVVPETEAQYPGGFKQLTKYLTDNIINKISEKSASKKVREAIVKFTINEEGQLIDAKIFKTSSDPKIDKLLLDAINKMPEWKPARNSKGIKVKQEFTIPLDDNNAC